MSDPDPINHTLLESLRAAYKRALNDAWQRHDWRAVVRAHEQIAEIDRLERSAP